MSNIINILLLLNLLSLQGKAETTVIQTPSKEAMESQKVSPNISELELLPRDILPKHKSLQAALDFSKWIQTNSLDFLTKSKSIAQNKSDFFRLTLEESYNKLLQILNGKDTLCKKSLNKNHCVKRNLNEILKLSHNWGLIDRYIEVTLIDYMGSISLDKKSMHISIKKINEPKKKKAKFKQFLPYYLLAYQQSYNKRKVGILKSRPMLDDENIFIIDRLMLGIIGQSQKSEKIKYLGQVLPHESYLIRTELSRPGNRINPLPDLTSPLKKLLLRLRKDQWVITSAPIVSEEIKKTLTPIAQEFLNLENKVNDLYFSIEEKNNTLNEGELLTSEQIKTEFADKIKNITDLRSNLLSSIQSLNDPIKNSNKSFQKSYDDFLAEFQAIDSDLNEKLIQLTENDITEEILQSDLTSKNASKESIKVTNYGIEEVELNNIKLSPSEAYNLFFNEYVRSLNYAIPNAKRFNIYPSLSMSITASYLWGVISFEELRAIIILPGLYTVKENKLKKILKFTLDLILPPLTLIDQTRMSAIAINVIKGLIDASKEMRNPQPETGIILRGKGI